jgi:hypothetical protein
MNESRFASVAIPGARSLALTLGLTVGIPAAAMADSAGQHDIIVTGQVTEQKLSLNKITTMLVDTPQAITIVGREELDQRGVTNQTRSASCPVLV